MILTTKQLSKIIKEELRAVLEAQKPFFDPERERWKFTGPKKPKLVSLDPKKQQTFDAIATSEYDDLQSMADFLAAQLDGDEDIEDEKDEKDGYVAQLWAYENPELNYILPFIEEYFKSIDYSYKKDGDNHPFWEFPKIKTEEDLFEAEKEDLLYELSWELIQKNPTGWDLGGKNKKDIVNRLKEGIEYIQEKMKEIRILQNPQLVLWEPMLLLIKLRRKLIELIQHPNTFPKQNGVWEDQLNDFHEKLDEKVNAMEKPT